MAKPPAKIKIGFTASGGGSLYSGLALDEDAPPQPVAGLKLPTQDAKGLAIPEDEVHGPEEKQEKPKGAQYRNRISPWLILISVAIAWSAALGFAPVVRKRPPPKAATSVPAGFIAATSTLVTVPPPDNRVLPSVQAAATISAPSTSTGWTRISASSEPLQTSLVPVQTRVIPKPPPLTLPEEDDDVNGFQKTEVGKRIAAQEGKRNKASDLQTSHSVDAVADQGYSGTRNDGDYRPIPLEISTRSTIPLGPMTTHVP